MKNIFHLCVIHLRSLVLELRKLVKKRKHPALIIGKADEIKESCNILLREHGEKSDIGKLLQDIKNQAGFITLAGKGINILGIPNPDERKRVEKIAFVRNVQMEDDLEKIYRILKIEYEETQG